MQQTLNLGFRSRAGPAAELADANVIAYSEARASAPFVGNGFVVRPKTLDIDVHRRASDGGGANAFTLLDIVAFHERLEAQFAIENAVENTATRKITAGHRLYVDGRKIPWSSDLIEPGRPVPRSRVSWEYLAEELTHPERADDRRVYFYLQEIGRDGEIGVCIFVRPLLQGGKLSLEFQPLVIPPIHPDVEALIADLPRTLRDQVARAARIWTLRVPAAVFGGPLRCALRAAALCPAGREVGVATRGAHQMAAVGEMELVLRPRRGDVRAGGRLLAGAGRVRPLRHPQATGDADR
ncbi:MAG: hypothetical protein ABW000_06350 [Actinoplanes sp.]